MLQVVGMMIGRKYKLYPSQAQGERMTSWGHTRRAIYNLGLEQRQLAWRLCRRTLWSTTQCHDLTELRNALDWVADPPAQMLQQALRDLDQAYRNWWNPNHPAGSPRFEKRSSILRFRLPGQAIQLRHLNRRWSEVKIPKLGWVKFRRSRPLDGAIRNATCTYKAGVWYVSVAVEAKAITPPPNAGPDVGVDFGVACAAYVSGEEASRMMPPILTPGEQRRLLGLERRKGRQLAYAKKHNKGQYSNRLRRTIHEIARLKARQARRRSDFTHKLTTDLAKNHGLVAIGDLKVANMTRSAKGTLDAPGKNVRQKAGLNRGILDVIPGERRRQLKYKCPKYGSDLMAVPPAGTSQICPKCGMRDPANRPGCGRAFKCVHCGYQAHADAVVAQNILNRAIALVGGGFAVGRTVNSAGRPSGSSPRRKTGGGSVKVAAQAGTTGA
jgi:putative transposase